MDSMEPKHALSQEEQMFPPLSPISELLSTTIMPINIIIVFEMETLATDEQIIQCCNRVLNFNARFSSVVDIDEKGIRRWKKVDVPVEDFVVVPAFPIGLSPTQYDEHFHEYLLKIAFEQFQEGRPKWEFHAIKYPTRHGSMSGVFKISHAIGDGYSLMSLLCHVFERADDPSLPLSLPNLSLKSKGVNHGYFGFVSKCINTISDFVSGMLKLSVLKDHPSAIRSMKPGVEYEPMEVSLITIPLEQVKQIKSKLDGTVNDVITGLIYYAIQLYIWNTGHVSSGTRMTSKVMFNTRVLKGYKNIEEMLSANIWGNYASFLQIPIPSFTNVEKVDPLYFITNAKENVDRTKNSMYGYFTFHVLKAVKSLRGLTAMANVAYKGLMNTSMTITNVIGPNEKMALMGNPINNFYFFMTGMPQSLVFTIFSYMGNIKFVAVTEKSFIDSELLISCMHEAFKNTFNAVCDRP